MVLTSLIRSLLRRRGWWLGAAALLLIVSVGLGSRLDLRGNMTDFLPTGSELFEATDGAGQRDRILVLLEAPGPMAAAAVSGLLDDLARRLAALPAVGRVEHRLPAELRAFASAEGPERALSSLTTRQLEALGQRLGRRGIERILLRREPPVSLMEAILRLDLSQADPLGVFAPVFARAGREAADLRSLRNDGYLVSPDGTAYFVIVEPRRPVVGIDEARSLVEGVEQVLREAGAAHRDAVADVTLSAIGRPVAYVRGTEIALRDARRIALATGVGLYLLLLVFLRRPLGPPILLATIFVALSVNAAIAFLALGSVSILAWIFVSVLGGVGVDCGLYVVTHYWMLSDPADSPVEALAAALSRPGRGILFGGLTNAATFLSLAAVSFPVMAELGWLSALGMLLVVAASFTVLPLFLSFTRPGRRPALGRWAGRLDPWPGRLRCTTWLLGWAALIAASLWAARDLRFEPHPWKVVLDANPATAELERVRQRLGHSFLPVVMASTGATAEEALERDREAVLSLHGIRARAGVAAIRSLSGLLPSVAEQSASRSYRAAHPETFSAIRFRRDFIDVVSQMEDPDPALIEHYLPLVERALRPREDDLTLERLRAAGLEPLIRRHLTQRDGMYRAVSFVFLERLPWTPRAVERFDETVERFGGPALARTEFLGDVARGGVSHSRLLLRNLVRASAVALLLVSAVLWLQFRRLRLVALCLTPLLCCVSGALGLMSILGAELNVLTLAIVPLMVGLGVDNGIHVVERLHRGEPPALALAETAPAMTLTTLSNVVGFSCLGLATFPGVRHVGLIGSAGLLLGLAAALQLVPLLYGATDFRGRGRHRGQIYLAPARRSRWPR